MIGNGVTSVLCAEDQMNQEIRKFVRNGAVPAGLGRFRRPSRHLRAGLSHAAASRLGSSRFRLIVKLCSERFQGIGRTRVGLCAGSR